MLQVPGKRDNGILTMRYYFTHPGDGPAGLKGVGRKKHNGEEDADDPHDGPPQGQRGQLLEGQKEGNSNKLLADNIDTLVKEEGKLNSNLKQVRQYLKDNTLKKLHDAGGQGVQGRLRQQ